MTASSDRDGRRTYDSSRRQAMAAETQVSVVSAAAQLFAERGWRGTSMRDVARAAGVSLETVYGAGGSKARLLVRAIEVGVVGDELPVPLAQRPEFQALGTGPRSDRLRAAAHMVSVQYARVARLHRTLEHAATGDADLAGTLGEIRAQQRTSFGDGVELIVGRTVEPEVVDGLQAIGSPEVYLQLVESAGWSSEQYQEWLAGTFGRLLDHIPEEKA